MLALALLGCSTLSGWPDGPADGGATSAPRIIVSPARLEFGDVSVIANGFAEAELTIHNVGGATETVSGHDEPIGSDAFRIDAPPLIELGPESSITLMVRYTPTTEQADIAELLVEPSDEAVRLTADGRAPVLAAGVAAFDEVVVGCSGTGRVGLRNEGSEPVTITGAALTSDEFALTSLPDTITPGGDAEIELAFTPDGGGARGGTLRLSSTDPLHPDIGIALSASGVSGEVVTESFRYTPSNPTDVLFVVSPRALLGLQGDAAADALPAFVDAIRDTNTDYHVSAISTLGPCPTSTPGWADRSDTSLQAEIVLENGFFGDGGPWEGDLLGLAVEALARSAAADCLLDYRRAEADLHVILVDDRPAAVDPTATAAELAAGLDTPASFQLSAILPLGDCGIDAPDYATLVERYAGTVHDLCAADWAPAFETLAELPAGRSAVRYVLAEIPVASTIEVLAEGLPFSAWSWDAATNAVVFDGDTLPALGAEVTVEYVSSVACVSPG